MIWVTWRQQRTQILLTAGIVLVLSAFLVYIRVDAAPILSDRPQLSDKYSGILNYFMLAMLALPALLGMFTGAPLFAREIEQGTHIFGLTQSVGRVRWMATKVLMAGGSLAVSMFALGLVAAWALEPMNIVIGSGRMVPPQFEIQGVTFGAYAITAFALGAVGGLLLRNTLPAMVVTLVVYTVLVISVANGVRPYYAEPTYFETPINSTIRDMARIESWEVGYGYFDANQKEVDFSVTECSRGPESFADCMRAKGVVTSFAQAHLPGQFWRFQLTEMGLFLVLTAGILGVGALAARRRLV